ncbi:H/ACA ribonucleoprotein complex subunit GAR1 [Halodesulfurarchaeum sp.]|uniref:H/ACA ribonucleoprotein complex subunit GAR1 n=1 Tax=Halodesulfurarchaeum sp. TaxID=1980530 RepID=UPI001BC34FB5|nr:H/ACA RNA-protein complex protein Gar1 [Halodesulfurarchaeum sp.]
MDRLGTVHRIAGNLLVLRAASADPAPIGATAIDENLDTVGRVVDVFGPTSKPYLAVTPSEAISPAGLVQKPLYWRPDR